MWGFPKHRSEPFSYDYGTGLHLNRKKSAVQSGDGIQSEQLRRILLVKLKKKKKIIITTKKIESACNATVQLEKKRQQV